MKRQFYLLLVLALTLLLTIPAFAEGDTVGTTAAAYQPFENGLMIWREDTGGIWVLSDNGWRATYYPQSEYENLPDNPIADDAPAGLVKPASGFGRVWGNFEGVRGSLGWATAEERAFTAGFERVLPTAGGFAQVSVNLPDGQTVLIREDDTWGLPGMARPISALPQSSRFPASLQAFENGYMLWWSETGTIWMLQDNGRARAYPPATFGAASPNTATAPAGFISPVMGFGKLWANNAAVRDALGWATGDEQAYIMRFEREVAAGSPGGPIMFVLTTPLDVPIIIYSNDTWRFWE